MASDVNSYARNLLAARGRRTVASLLTYMEDNLWEHVPVPLQVEARQRILSLIGDFQDLAMDMVAADTGTINDYWVDAIDGLHDAIRKVSRD